MKLLLCSFVILATVSASVADVNATTVEDFEADVNATTVEEFEADVNATTVEDFEADKNATTVEDFEADVNATRVEDFDADVNATRVEDFEADVNATTVEDFDSVNATTVEDFDSENATTVEDFDSENATTVEDFDRCFFYNRIPKPKFKRVKVGAFDFYDCRVRCAMEKECLYFQVRNDKCFKYVVEDRPRKKFVYGLAFCKEPGVPTENALPCMEQGGTPITRTKKYKKVGYPVQCANMCEGMERCILWAWNKKTLTCKVTLLKANLKTEGFSSFDRSYCYYPFTDTTPISTPPTYTTDTTTAA